MFPLGSLDEYPENMRDQVELFRRKLRRRVIASRILSVLAWFARGAVLIGLSFLIALATDRAPPVTSSFVLLTPEVAPGGRIVLRIVANRTRLCASMATYRIFDGDGNLLRSIDIPWETTRGPLGMDAPFNRTFALSDDARPGTGRIRIDNAWRCPGNPFHEIWPITTLYADIPFTIAAK